MSDAGVIGKEEDPTFWNVIWKQLLWPDDSIFDPSLYHVPLRPMQEDDAASLASVWIHRRLGKESLTRLCVLPIVYLQKTVLEHLEYALIV